jgi:hypothetical protein
MKKKDLAARLAKQTRQTEGAAADALDQAIHGVLKGIRRRENSKPNALERLLEEAKCESEEKGRHAKS